MLSDDARLLLRALLNAKAPLSVADTGLTPERFRAALDEVRAEGVEVQEGVVH